MASSNKTAHLQLNQWLGTDPVLRTDFNLDNNKLDTAIQARALVRLTGTTLSSASATLALTLPTQTLSGCTALQVYLAPKTSAESVVSLQVGSSTAVSLAAMAADGTRGLWLHLCFLPGGLGGWWFAPGGSGTISGAFQLPGVTASQATTLTFTCAGSAAYQSGTSCQVYGVMQ